MLIQASIDSKGKREFWCEVISTATRLDNIMVRPERTKPPHTLLYGKDAKCMKYMRTCGEMAVVAIHESKKMRSKLDNRGKTCMFVGYADDHSGDVCRFLNIHTKKIIMSRDVRWLNIIWKHYRRKSIYARKQVELFVEFWGLPPLILFYNTSTGWFGRFVLSTECYRTRKLDYNDLNGQDALHRSQRVWR